MNLRFVTVTDTGTHLLQRANVTNIPVFWRAWRTAKAMEAYGHSRSLLSLITLRREVVEGTPQWFAYRQVPKCPDDPPAHFPLSYTLSSIEGLLPFQPASVRHICNAIVSHGAAIDGSDTGIGKTYVALAAARDLHYRPGVICKKAGIASWKRAARQFNVDPLFIVNWEFAKSPKFPFIKRERDLYSNEYHYSWKLPTNTLLIFDEVHSANHIGSLNCALYMGSRGTPSLSCSATFADRPERLQPLLHVLGVVDSSKFKEWIGVRHDYFVDQRNKMEFLSDIDAMKDFNRLLYPRYGYRLTYEDPEVKSHFPEVVYQTEIVSLGADVTREQNDLYKEMLARVNYYKELGKTAEKLVAELRYRQSTELLKGDALVELAQNYILEGHSVCIFVNYRETLAYLSKRLHTQSLIFGDQDRYGLPRERIIDAFQSNQTNLILCMVDAGGQSISLHDLHGGHPRISLICPTYDAVKLKQVLGRTYRAGGKTKPVVKLVYAAGTVEEKVAETVNSKLTNISALNDGDLFDDDFFGFT